MADTFDVEMKYYQTPIYNSEAEAWKDLMDYLRPLVDDHWVWFRVLPEVASEFNYDTKERVYAGFVRFVVNPTPLGLKENEMNIPRIGKAK